MTTLVQATTPTVRDLLRKYGSVLSELRRLRVATTNDSPVGGYGEWLVECAFGGERQGNSNKSVDVIAADGSRLQVKTRRLLRPKNSIQLSQIRNLDSPNFDSLVAVILDEEFEVVEAWQIPHAVVRRLARHVGHTNSHRFVLSPEVRGDPACLDITEKVKAAQQSPAPG